MRIHEEPSETGGMPHVLELVTGRDDRGRPAARWIQLWGEPGKVVQVPLATFERMVREAVRFRVVVLVFMLAILAGCSEVHDDVTAHRRAVVELLQVLEPVPGVSADVVDFRLGRVRWTLRKLEDDTKPAPRPDELPVILSLPSGGGR